MSKPYALRAGSIPWHASRLSIGESFYVPLSCTDEANPIARVKLTIDRAIASGRLDGAFLVRMCTGFRADLQSAPFRFVSVERTS